VYGLHCWFWTISFQHDWKWYICTVP
jgi:hypothetical protein